MRIDFFVSVSNNSSTSNAQLYNGGKQDCSLIKLMGDYIEVTADMNLSLTSGFSRLLIFPGPRVMCRAKN